MQRNHQKMEAACSRIALRMHPRAGVRTKGAHQRRDIGQRGRLVFGVDVSSFACGIICLQPRKNAIRRTCASRNFRLQKRAADLSFLLHTANGDIGLVVLPFSVLLRSCITALLR
jgi:hypothetical protein